MLLHKYFDFLPEGLRAQSIIAGSSAVDYARATDVDIFVMRVPEDERMQRVAEITQHLVVGMRQPFKMHVACFNRGTYKNFLAVTIDAPIVRPQVEYQGCKPVQIILTTAPRARDVIDYFDLSVCMRAVKFNNVVVQGTKYTPPTQPIVIYDRHQNTYNRYAKLCIRYGLAPDVNIVPSASARVQAAINNLDSARLDWSSVTGHISSRSARIPLRVNPTAVADQPVADVANQVLEHLYPQTERDTDAIDALQYGLNDAIHLTAARAGQPISLPSAPFGPRIERNNTQVELIQTQRSVENADAYRDALQFGSEVHDVIGPNRNGEVFYDYVLRTYGNTRYGA